MLIVVTDEGRFWNHTTPILEKYANCVLVVCLNGKEVSTKYKCFVSPYNKTLGLGMLDVSMTGQKYAALETVASELSRKFGYHDDILFLTDNEPQSLFPYLATKRHTEFNNIHLWTMSPWVFDTQKNQKDYWDLLYDLTDLQSLLFVDSSEILKQMDKSAHITDLYKTCSDYFENLLPSVVYEIGHKPFEFRKSYYDLSINRYVEIENSYEAITNISPISKEEVEQFVPHKMYSTLGLLVCDDEPSGCDSAKRFVNKIHPRINGKQICEQLKAMRKDLALANNIEYDPVDCPSTGPCAGTCVQCDKEIKELQQKLMQIPVEARCYPKHIIETDCEDILSPQREIEEDIMGLISPGEWV